MASPSVHGGKILVFPVDGSHWVNMDLIVQRLHARGHEVTVVRTATSWYIKEISPHCRSVTISLPEAICIEEPNFFHSFLSEMLKIQKDGGALSFVRFYWEVLDTLSMIHQQASMMGVEIFKNKTRVTAGDGHFVVAPSPTSYVPISGNAMSDRMTFAQT